ncbi:hypothetical protein JCM19235_5667 [Vibrio maritimus]|uniref:Uncharacterized protein n=1 Tax=Vibrio maritimus TaxID=990268 RepID=A0A090RRD4_9VIBR|nr:hypothetical protein JCM19235_5667 [Vibrio maritimus]
MLDEEMHLRAGELMEIPYSTARLLNDFCPAYWDLFAPLF